MLSDGVHEFRGSLLSRVSGDEGRAPFIHARLLHPPESEASATLDCLGNFNKINFAAVRESFDGFLCWMLKNVRFLKCLHYVLELNVLICTFSKKVKLVKYMTLYHSTRVANVDLIYGKNLRVLLFRMKTSCYGSALRMWSCLFWTIYVCSLISTL